METEALGFDRQNTDAARPFLKISVVFPLWNLIDLAVVKGNPLDHIRQGPTAKAFATRCRAALKKRFPSAVVQVNESEYNEGWRAIVLVEHPEIGYGARVYNAEHDILRMLKTIMNEDLEKYLSIKLPTKK